MMRKLPREFSHDSSRTIKKRSELPSRLSCRSPLFQHRRQEPSRKIFSATDHRCPFDVHSEELVSESNCAGDPIRLPPRTRQASIPIEVITTPLEQDAYVAKPDRKHCAVPKQVHAKEAQVVFGAQYSYIHFAELDQSGPGKDVIGSSVIKLTETLVQVDIAVLAFRTLEGFRGSRVIAGQHAKIEIDIRPHARLRIKPRNRPPFDQQRVNAG